MDLLKRTIEPSNIKMPFGKHKGKRLSEIPIQYLEWMLGAHVGGGELLSDIAAFLSVPVPKKKVSYEGKTISRDDLERLQSKPGFHQVNKFCDGTDIMGVANCWELFNPDSDWPDEQQWDGLTAPWLDQSAVIDNEFKEMFR